MTKRHIELLTEAHNFAIVQMEGRRFPGVVFQGDSLQVLINQIELIESMSRKHSDLDLSEEIADVLELLRDVRSAYEEVCREKGLRLPYERHD